jgi:hypothetical protein
MIRARGGSVSFRGSAGSRAAGTSADYRLVEQRGPSLKDGFRARMELEDPGGPFDGRRFIKDWQK